jgi:hypothetical protein
VVRRAASPRWGWGGVVRHAASARWGWGGVVRHAASARWGWGGVVRSRRLPVGLEVRPTCGTFSKFTRRAMT